MTFADLITAIEADIADQQAWAASLQEQIDANLPFIGARLLGLEETDPKS